MKKMLSILLAVSVMFVSVMTAYTHGEAAEVENVVLSEMSDEDVLKFLSDNGITVPDGFAESTSEIIRIVRIWMQRVETNPAIEFTYSLTSLYEFANQVKNAVNSYYGIDEKVSTFSVWSASEYTLQDSTFYEWMSGMVHYNCYAYAIRETSFAYDPGEFSGQKVTLDEIEDITAYILALRTKADLEALGYSSVTITTERPSYSASQTAICVRKGYCAATGLGDYHYMRVTYGDVWRHKPGRTAVLQYNYLPSTSRDWTNEYIDVDAGELEDVMTACEPTAVYTGAIYYIIYSN